MSGHTQQDEQLSSRSRYADCILRAWRFSTQPQIIRTVFACGLALLGVCLGIDKPPYAITMLRIVCGVSLIGMIPYLQKMRWRDCPLGLAATVLFGIYVLVTPGDWLADYKLGWRILTPLLIGVMMPFLLLQGLRVLVFSIASSLLVLFAYALFTGGEWGYADGRLCLRAGHFNTLAALLAWLLLFFIWFWNRAARPWKYWSVILAVCCLVMLVQANSRISLLGFAVAAFFLLLRCYRWKSAVVVLLVGALCVGIAFLQLNGEQQERTFNSILNLQQDKTFLSRKPIWEVSLAGIAEKPWLGRSVKAFVPFHSAYIETNAERLDKKYPIVERKVWHAHNLYLELLFSWGIAGSALLCVGVGQGILFARRQGDAFFQAMMLFLFVHGLVEWNIHTIQGCVGLFLPLGIVYGRELAGRLGLQLSAPETCK